MKKILMLLAAASIVMTAIGCGAKEETGTTATTGTTTGTTGASTSQGSSETSDK